MERFESASWCRFERKEEGWITLSEAFQKLERKKTWPSVQDIPAYASDWRSKQVSNFSCASEVVSSKKCSVARDYSLLLLCYWFHYTPSYGVWTIITAFYWRFKCGATMFNLFYENFNLFRPIRFFRPVPVLELKFNFQGSTQVTDCWKRRVYD